LRFPEFYHGRSAELQTLCWSRCLRVERDAAELKCFLSCSVTGCETEFHSASRRTGQPILQKREVPIVTTAPPSGFKCDGISPVPASPVQVAEAEVVAEPDTLPWQQPPYHPCKSGSLPEAVVAVVAAAVAAEPRGCPSSNGRQD